MNAVKEDVIKLVEKELKSANDKFPLFASDHEGYAVIKEEVEEVEEVVKYLDDILGFAWKGIRNNAEQLYFVSLMNSLKRTAIEVTIEAIQVAAMAQKSIDSAESREDKG